MEEQNQVQEEQQIEQPEDHLQNEELPEEQHLQQDDPQHLQDDPEPSRGANRIQALANDRKQAQEDARLARQQADLYRQQLEQLQRQSQPPEDLDPMQRWQRDANIAIQRSHLMAMDAADRSNFSLKLADRADLRPYSDEVETRLQTIRNNGGNPTREQVLTVILGERAMQRMAKAPKAKAEAAERVRAAQGKPLGTPSSVQPGKRDSTLYDRLKDTPI